MMKISFVILHYKDFATTKQCVQSILSMETSEKCEIVVVDNDVHEPEEKRKQLTDYYVNHTNIHVIRVKKDLGFSYANNVGYYYAKKKLGADCIIVTNNDITFIQKDFLIRLENIGSDECHVISPDVIRASDGKHQSPIDTELRNRSQLLRTIRFHRFSLRHFKLTYPFIYFYMKQLDKKSARQERLSDYAQRQDNIVPFGACLIFTNAFVSREEKAFTPETKFYYEEYILARRCREKGYRIEYYPDLHVLHESGKATRSTYQSDKQRIRFIMKNTLQSAKKYLQTEKSEHKPKILYFMSVDWNWIAQRPHFFALALNEYYDVTVIYPRFLIRNWKAQKSTPKPAKCSGVPQIPLQERIKALRFLGDALFSCYIGDIRQYDMIWLGTPLYSRFIPEDYKGVVIYDYMDDIVALQKDNAVKKIVGQSHEWLVDRADYIFATSSFLQKKISHKENNSIHLIRNGFEFEKIYAPGTRKKNDNLIRFGYVGTIAEWIDFPTLLCSLEKYPQLEYHFWGPAATKVPGHDRIILHGIIEHKEIYSRIKDMDCMIVPFKVNDIILAVDPVKIYEYISFGKNVICVDYPEVRHFGDFVFYYQDKESYLSLIQQLIEDDFRVRYTKEEQEEFLKHCTWKARSEEVYTILSDQI